jgi:hypothetical protein
LGRSEWPSDRSLAAATDSRAGRRMTASAFQPPDSRGSISLRIPGGDDAPTRARRWVRSLLEGQIPATSASDAALLVSELVTNSVVHAHVDGRGALTVEVTTLDDRLRIAVTDPGSPLTPRILPRDPETPGGPRAVAGRRALRDMGSLAGRRPYLCLVRAPARSIAPSIVTTPTANAPTLSRRPSARRLPCVSTAPAEKQDLCSL